MSIPVEGTVEQSVDTPDFEAMDQAAFERYRRGEKEPVQESSEAADEAQPEDTPQDSDPGDEDQELTDDQPVKGRRLQKRFDQLTAKIRELEAQVASKPGTASPQPEAGNGQPKAADEDPEPDPNKYDDYDKYAVDKARWQLKREDKAKAQVEAEQKAKADAEKMVSDYSARVKELVKQPQYADFSAKVGPIGRVLHPAIAEAVMTDENGPQVAYEVAKDPKLLERLQGMSLPAAIRELGKISAKFDKPPEAPKPPVSKAPPPVKPVSAANAAPVSKSIYDEGLSQADYEKLRRAQLRRK